MGPGSAGHRSGRDGGSAWLVVLAGVSAALHVAKLSPAIPALRRELGVTLVTSGLLLSMSLLAGATLGLVIGLLVDRIGLRRSQITGLSILTVAGLGGGWAPDERVLLGLRAAEGLGFLLSTVPAPGLLRRLVDPARTTRMLGIWSAFIPVGAAVALLLGPTVLETAGWRWWWWATGAVSGGVALLVWRRVPSDPVRGHGVGDVDTEPWTRRLGATLSTAGPWLGAGVFAVYAAQWLAVIGFLPAVYAASGWTGALGAVLTAAVAAANAVGNVAAGVLAQRGVPARALLVVGFAAMAVGTVLAFAEATEQLPVLRYAGALLFSGPGGLIPGTLFTLAPRLAPTERTISTTVGWMQQWSGIGQVAGPPLVAALATRVGGWQWTWLLTGTWCAMGMVLAVLTGHLVRRRRAP